MVNKNRLTEEFCKLVSIDSVSFGERDFADEMVKSLSSLGFDVKEDGAGEVYGGNCGNIYGFLKGEVKGEPILFSAHMDTVEPGINKKAVVHDGGRITSDGKTVLGADDVSGIVSILEAFRTIKELSLPHRDIEILFTIAEEKYIRGSEVFDYGTLHAKEAYVLDLSGDVGTAALRAPTILSFGIEVSGKASHAGFAPEQGINAIAVLAEVITRIKQGRIDEETTVNIGIIEGGKATNIVPDACRIQGEIRSYVHQKALSQLDVIENIVQELTAKAKAEYKLEKSIGSMAYQVEQNHPVVRRFEEACKELGVETQLISTFGGSDNNNFFRNGIMGIVLACGMNQVHSCQEYTDIGELVKCSNIVLKLMTSEEKGERISMKG